MREIQYFIDPLNGVVVAKLTNLQDSLIKEMKSVTNGCFSWETYVKIASKFPNTLTSKAMCSPEDQFSEEVGIQIARAKLLYKVNRNRSKALRLIGDKVSALLNETLNKADKAESISEKHLKNLVNFEENIDFSN